MPGPSELRERFGRYRILSRIGAGGMGTVYLAEDTRLQRRVALKVPHFTEEDDPAAVPRFYREAQVAGSIDHPNICPVFEIDELDGVHYFTMPYIEGDNLVHLIDRDNPWPPQEATALLRKLALAMAEMHKRG